MKMRNRRRKFTHMHRVVTLRLSSQVSEQLRALTVPVRQVVLSKALREWVMKGCP